MEIEIIRADPAGNITIFVLPPVDTIDTGRLVIAHRLLADPALGAEQVGFVIRPEAVPGRLWRLEMMGEEFCGNAARSFGFFAAMEEGRGATGIKVEVSGMKEPLTVQADMDRGWAEVRIPGPIRQEELDWEGRSLPVYVFDGITHVIACNIQADEKTFFAVKERLERKGRGPDALGLMFRDENTGKMVPLVYVKKTGSLVAESSCGSGSAAMAVYLSRDLWDGEARVELRQPGGIIEAAVCKQAGEVRSITIGGKVSLSGRIRFKVE
jgi:diaminopimelate epimerase